MKRVIFTNSAKPHNTALFVHNEVIDFVGKNCFGKDVDGIEKRHNKLIEFICKYKNDTWG